MSQAKNRSAELGTLAFPAVFLVVGLVMLVLSVPSLAKVQAIRTTWTQIDGIVLESRVATQSGSDGDTYKAVVHYRYEVGDRTYESDVVTVGLDLLSSDSCEAHSIVGRFPAGQPCRVWINPSDPADSVLVLAITSSLVIVLLVGAVFTCFGLAMLLFALGAVRSRRGLPAAAAALRQGGWDGIRLGYYRLELSPNGHVVRETTRLLPSMLLGAGVLGLVVGVPLVVLFQNLTWETRLTLIECSLLVGAALGMLHFLTASRTIRVDRRCGVLARDWRILGFPRHRQWPLDQVTALRLRVAGDGDGGKVQSLAVESRNNSSAEILQDATQPDTVLLVAAVLASAIERPLVIDSHLDPGDLALGLDAVRDAGLIHVLRPTDTPTDSAHELPAALRGVARKLTGAFEKLGFHPPAATPPSPVRDAAVQSRRDPLTVGEPADQALPLVDGPSNSSRFAPGCFLVAFGLAFGGFAVAFLVITFGLPAIDFVRAQSWPTTDGRVLEVSRRRESDMDGETYWPRVRYQYTVEGRQYENDRPQLAAFGSSSTSPADRILARYHVGQTVLVHYDPADPQGSALEILFPPFAIGVPGFILVFLLVGIGVGTSGRSSSRQRRQFKRLVACLAALSGDGCVGRWQFSWNDHQWSAHRQPRVAWWIAGPAVAIGAPLGIVTLLLMSDAPTLQLMAVAWGLPLAFGLAIGLTRLHERLRLEAGAAGRPVIVWTKTGRGRRQRRRQWPLDSLVALYLDAKRRTTTSDDGTTTTVTYKLQALSVDGSLVSLLDSEPDDPAGALLVAGLVAASGQAIWIARDVESDQAGVLREALQAAETLDRARVVDRISETSWSTVLAAAEAQDRPGGPSG